ncbi:MAG: hypothetical protein ACOC38_04420 [Promethearchaeia archaeon]
MQQAASSRKIATLLLALLTWSLTINQSFVSITLSHSLGGLVSNHECISLESIPTEWLEQPKDAIKVHYAHTSHGGQITTGLQRIESANATFDSAIGSGILPIEESALFLLDGNPPDSYITPDLYCSTANGLSITQNTLDNNPTLTVSIWSCCTQLNYYSSSEVQTYLDAMNSLESDNPDVAFIYMTGNAQSSGSDGYTRWQNNGLIREYCAENDKVLFDFADLDYWYEGEHSTYEYENDGETFDVPVEHKAFDGNEAGHRTYSSCEQEGKDFWWLMTRLAGWSAETESSTTDSTIPTTTADDSSPESDYKLLLGVGGVTGAIMIIALVVIMRRRN